MYSRMEISQEVGGRHAIGDGWFLSNACSIVPRPLGSKDWLIRSILHCIIRNCGEGVVNIPSHSWRDSVCGSNKV